MKLRNCASSQDIARNRKGRDGTVRNKTNQIWGPFSSQIWANEMGTQLAQGHSMKWAWNRGTLTRVHENGPLDCEASRTLMQNFYSSRYAKVKEECKKSAHQLQKVYLLEQH